MHTEGFQPSRSFWRRQKRQRTVRVGGEEGRWQKDTGPKVAAGSHDTLPYPDIFKHLHGRKGL